MNICLLGVLETVILLCIDCTRCALLIQFYCLSTTLAFRLATANTFDIFFQCIRRNVRAFKQIVLSFFTKTVVQFMLFHKSLSLNFISIGKWIFFSCLMFCSFFFAFIYFPSLVQQLSSIMFSFRLFVCVCVKCQEICTFQPKVFVKSFCLLFLLAHKTAKLQIYDNTLV